MSASWAGGSTRTWRKLRLFVLDRDGFACQVPVRGGTEDNGGQVCGAFATHVDHIVPLSKGGPKYDDRNCRAACSSCNLRRGDRLELKPPRQRGRSPLSTVRMDWSW